MKIEEGLVQIEVWYVSVPNDALPKRMQSKSFNNLCPYIVPKEYKKSRQWEKVIYKFNTK